MVAGSPPPLVLDQRIDPAALADRVRWFFGDRVKFVADVARGRIALGADMHADLVPFLTDTGSDPEQLWGASYYPGRGTERCLEFSSQLNARPSRGNPGTEIVDERVRARVRDLAFALIGTGDPLP
jgi:hypothetical protein